MIKSKYSAIHDYDYYKIFGTSVKQQLLEYMMKNPEKEMSIKELSTKIKMPHSSLSQALGDLNKVHILNRRSEGKYTYYKLDKRYAVHFQKIFDSLKEVYAASMKQQHNSK